MKTKKTLGTSRKNDGIHLRRQWDPYFEYLIKTMKTFRKNNKTKVGSKQDPTGSTSNESRKC